jgi:hypothetical protein
MSGKRAKGKEIQGAEMYNAQERQRARNTAARSIV